MKSRPPVVRVTEECLGVGNCLRIAPLVFALDDEGYSRPIIDEVPEDAIELVKTAVQSCPTGAIEILDCDSL